MPVMFLVDTRLLIRLPLTEYDALKPNWLICSLNEPDMSGAALLTAYGKWMSKSSYVAGTASVKGWCGFFLSEGGHHLGETR
jgi:hypothetical protein